MPFPSIPTLAICGWSGVGKTTLIESLLPRLEEKGLAVGVWKHDAHRLDVDREGKDTDRFHRAGATFVIGEDAEQCFGRTTRSGEETVSRLLKGFPLDLLIVEGHKSSPFPKVWIQGPPESEPGHPDLHNRLKSFPRTDTLVEEVEGFIQDWLMETWRSRPTRTAILMGGRSERMGVPKTLLEVEGVPVLERICRRIQGAVGDEIVLSGSGPIPPAIRDRYTVLPDVEGGGCPLSGILSLLRWDPHCAWSVIGCDMPEMSGGYVDWLRGLRSPGKWAIAPHLPGEDRIQPLAALYEPQIAPALEEAWGTGEHSLQKALKAPRVDSPEVPEELEATLKNLNTPEEWEAYISDAERVDTEIGK